MTALEVIKKGAVLLNLKEVLEDEGLTAVTEENSDEKLENNFVLNRCFEILKILLDDIASDKFPIVKTAKFISSEKQIDLSNIENFMKVCAVSIDRVPVKYKISNNAIQTPFEGVFDVKYMVYPKINNLVSEIEMFDRGIGSDMLVYGMLSLYCLAVGLIDEFERYNAIYEEKLKAVENLQIIDMPCRSWL